MVFLDFGPMVPLYVGVPLVISPHFCQTLYSIDSKRESSDFIMSFLTQNEMNALIDI